jgi:hypothetical protein
MASQVEAPLSPPVPSGPLPSPYPGRIMKGHADEDRFYDRH